MPIVYSNHYGQKARSDGQEGHILITPTKQTFVESDHTDVRLDRVRIFDRSGRLIHSYLQDTMGVRFTDNLSHTEDDLSYLQSLPKEAK
jgi:hypothetical protein